MLEARLVQGGMLKKVVDAVKVRGGRCPREGWEPRAPAPCCARTVLARAARACLHPRPSAAALLPLLTGYRTQDLVTEANIDVSNSGFQLQAMDTSHVSLIAMHLRSDAFEHFRCDRAMSMGEWRPAACSDGP